MKNSKMLKGIAAMLAALFVILPISNVQSAKAAYTAESLANASSIELQVQYGQTEARTMLAMINALRTNSSRAWVLTKDGSKKYLSNLKPLTYDYRLEEIAMQRAAEIALNFDHVRPNGTNVFSLMSEYGYNTHASENIAIGITSAAKVFEAFSEENAGYSGQGHRRNMLGENYTSVAFGHAYVNGLHHWVQVFSGVNLQTAATPANNSAANVTINSVNGYFSNIVLEGSNSPITLTSGQGAPLPNVSAKFVDSNIFYYGRINVVPHIIWTSSNTSVAFLQGTTIVAKNPGTAKITGTMMGGKIEIKVTVKSGSDFANAVKPQKAYNFRSRSSIYGVTLTWDEVPGADGYIIYHRVGNTGNFSYLYMTSKTSFTDLFASAESWNFYMVFPYYTIGGKRVVNTISDYVFGRKVL